MNTYLREAYMLPLMLCAPMVLTMLLMKTWFVPHTYPQLALHLVAAGLVYGAGLFWAFASNRLTEFAQPPAAKATLDMAAAVTVDNAC